MRPAVFASRLSRKIPDLLDKLGKETDTMAKKIKEKTEQAEQLAAIINNAASESGAKRK